MKESQLASISQLKSLDVRWEETSDDWLHPNDPSTFTGEICEGGTVEEVLHFLSDRTLKPVGIVKCKYDDGIDFRVGWWVSMTRPTLRG